MTAYIIFDEILSICSQDSGIDILTSIKGHIPVTNERKMMRNNPNIDLVNINAYTLSKKVLHNWGLWQFISKTGNTRLHDLKPHLVPSLRNILFETESKPREKCLRNMCLMVPGVGNQKRQNDRFSMLYSVSDSALDYLVNSNSKITSRLLCKKLHESTNV